MLLAGSIGESLGSACNISIWIVTEGLSIDIKVLDALGGKSASVRAGHFMVVYVDDRESLKSEMKPGDPPPQWRERCQL